MPNPWSVTGIMTLKVASHQPGTTNKTCLWRDFVSKTLTSCLLLPVAVFSSSSSSLCTFRCAFGKGVSFFARYAQNSVGFFSSGSNDVTGCLASLVISEPADKPKLWDAHPSPVSATNRRDIWSSSQQDVPPIASSCGLCFAIELVPELVLTLL